MGIKTKIYSILTVSFWVGLLTGVLAVMLYVYLVSVDFNGWFGGMPSLERLENPKSEVASELYTSDNVLLGKYFRENRSPIEYEQLSPNLINALIATEDIRFEEHSGIDLIGTFAIAWYMLNDEKRGSSTISQQLAKNLFDTRSSAYEGTLAKKNKGLRMLINKTKEWITAVKLERSYTKREILTMYLNTVDFGSNAFGIKVASETFFKITPDSLTVPQSAILVGLLKAPTQFSPISNPENCLERRNTVFGQMQKAGHISAVQLDSLKALPLALNYSVENHNKGSATYFRGVISEYLLKWSKSRGIDLYADGLKIYCTIDSRIQKYAEEAVEEHMKDQQSKFFTHWKKRNPWIDEEGKELKGFIERTAKTTDRFKALKKKYNGDTIRVWKELNKKDTIKVFTWKGEKDTLMSFMDSIRYYKHFLHTGFMAMEPHTGHIKAWVGGINFKHFKYDHVMQGKRQPGSTFKPIVYATAINFGYSPCYELPDLPVSFPSYDEKNSIWTPQNSDGKFTGQLFTLRKAMANSINSITANLISRVSPQKVVDLAKDLGIKSHLDPVAALCLGVCDVSVYELVGAYSTFANKGVYTEPFFISRIEDKNGNILQEFSPKKIEAMNEQDAYLMVHMLKGATEEKGGTALGLNRWGLLGYGNEIGAKTGTTQNYSDGWFVGITPKLAAGAWVGGEDRCIHFTDMNLGQGARMAMPIWGLFMQKLYKDASLGIKKERFPAPGNPLNIELNCAKYKEKSPVGLDSLQYNNIKQGIPNEW